jgi:hypothetical protein
MIGTFFQVNINIPLEKNHVIVQNKKMNLLENIDRIFTNI